MLWMLLILLALLAASGWLGSQAWQQLEASRQQQAEQVRRNEENVRALQTQLQALQATLSGDLQQRLQQLQQQQQSLERGVNDLYVRQRKIGDRDEQNVVEISYLLRIAQHRLILGQDSQAALAALKAADERLRQIDDPRMLAAREQLASDINRLLAIRWPDIDGMALRLADYANRIEQLPLLQGRQQAEAKPPAAETKTPARDWDELPSAVMDELKKLVVIRYNENSDTGLLAPEQQYFLLQNLRLTLEAARLALLQRHTKDFRGAVAKAQDWLKRYFDQNSPEVAAMQAELARMQQAELLPELPDITHAMTTLEELSRPIVVTPPPEKSPTMPPAAPAAQPEATLP